MLAKELRQQQLIGDLPLLPQDIERLLGLVQSKPKQKNLPQIAPNALACALVFAVHQCVEEADYWPLISRKFQIDQEQLRKFFDDYLLHSPLATPYKQQTPSQADGVSLIFVQAGIPPHHLGEFLVKFVLPLVKEGTATTPEAAKNVLTAIRQEAARPQRVQKRVHSIEEMGFTRRDLPATIEQLQAIEDFLALEAESKAAGDFGKDFTNLDALIEVYQEQIDAIKADISNAREAERETLVEEYNQVCRDYEALLQKVVASGGGDVEAARSRIATWQEARNAVDLCFAHLLGSIPKFQELVEFVREMQGRDEAPTEGPHNAGDSAIAPGIQHGATPENSDEANKEGVLANIAYPIRRYLLHGGNSAERLLYNCVLLLRHARELGTLDRPSLQRIPPYLVQPFLYWWADQRAFSPRTSMSEERYQPPWIQLNLQTHRPQLVFPPQRCKVLVGDLKLVITDALSEQEVTRIQVHGRRRGAALVETESHTFELNPGLRAVKLSLQDGDLKVKEWEIPFQTENLPYQFFDARDGRLCPTVRQLARVWLMIAHEATLQGQGYAITSEFAMDEAWLDYRLVELDLTALQELYLQHANHTRHRLFDKAEAYCEVSLEGIVNQIGKHIEEFPLYTSTMPSLELCYSDEQLLDSATLTIEVDTPQQSLRWPLRDCLPFAQQQIAGKIHSLSIDLAALLGGIRYGCIRLSLTNLPGEDWYQVFCQVPALNARFDAPLYLPWYAAKAPRAMLKLEIPPYAEIVAYAPAQSNELQPGLWEIEVGLEEVEIMGNLRWEAEQQRFDIPLTFEIPKLLWLLSAEVRRAENVHLEENLYRERQRQELWLDDWTDLKEQELWIKVPAYVQGNIRLTSPDLTERNEERPIVDQIAKFDLSAWRALLRKGKPVKSLQVTHLPLKDVSGKPYFHHAQIFTVRSQWEAQEIGCVQTAPGNRIKLQVGWLEKGKAEERTLYLWRQTGELILEQSLEPGVFICDIAPTRTPLLPGAYLIQLAAIDAWGQAEPQYPGTHALSTLRIKIVAAQELHQDEAIMIQAAFSEGTRHDLSIPYQIRITGRIIGQNIANDLKLNGVIVKTTNQDWYWGELLASGHAEQDAEIRASNPIKFPESLLTTGIGAIEARDGEGAMYCRHCKQLHWRHESTMDPRHASQLLGPINRFQRKLVGQRITSH